VCVCVCVYAVPHGCEQLEDLGVCERERGRERERVCVWCRMDASSLKISVCVCV